MNLYRHDEWEWERERQGWGLRAAELGRRPGDDLIYGSLYELPPGGKSFPYHFHYGEEELLIVLAGRPTLRAPDGEQELRAGDCVSFPVGPQGAHLLHNGANEPARFVIFSSASNPEVAVYPDSAKFGFWAGGPDDHVDMFVRSDAKVDYWEGEKGSP